MRPLGVFMNPSVPEPRDVFHLQPALLLPGEAMALLLAPVKYKVHAPCEIQDERCSAYFLGPGSVLTIMRCIHGVRHCFGSLTPRVPL